MKEQNQELETPVEPLVMTGEDLRKALGIPEGAEIAAIPVDHVAIDPNLPSDYKFPEIPDVAGNSMARKVAELAAIQLAKTQHALLNPPKVEDESTHRNREKFFKWKADMDRFLASPNSRRPENCIQFLRDSGWIAIEIADAFSNPEA